MSAAVDQDISSESQPTELPPSVTSQVKPRFQIEPVTVGSHEEPQPTPPKTSEDKTAHKGGKTGEKPSELPIIDSLRRHNRQLSNSSAKQKIGTPLKKIASFFGVEQDSENAESDDRSMDTSAHSTIGERAVHLKYSETIERMPSIDYYRNAMSLKRPATHRPTLADLLDDNNGYDSDSYEASVAGGEGKSEADAASASSRSYREKNRISVVPQAVNGDIESAKKSSDQQTKFGWIKGVLIRCSLNILGVMLFLRLTWITGQAGIGLATVIVLLSSSVSFLTCLSMCAICTNGEVKAGGVYFMLSRSLGPEFGGSIGIIFAFANAVNIALNVVGFSESFVDLLNNAGVHVDIGTDNSIRVIGLSAVVILLMICLIGLSFEAAMQMVLLVVLSAAIFNYLIGTMIGPNGDPEKLSKGFTGFNSTTFITNFSPDFRSDESGSYDFIKVFAIFFPSVTGIAAGANMSGDLKDPQKAIPKGTLLAILITDIIYIIFIWFAGATVTRDALGPVNDTIPYTCSNFTNGHCMYGLSNDFQVAELESGWPPLISAGIFAATLSSALACLVSAPKIFQAVCNDKIYPYIHWFGKGYGKGKEPRRAYALAFFIACGIILIADLNKIAPIISNFYLASYALINYACFDASIANSPGFRPSFKYYSKWLALLGALLCVSVMFVINPITALVTVAIFAILYLYTLRRKPDVNWGSSTQANMYTQALRLMQKLQYTREHVKTYRPQILVLTGNPPDRPILCDFANGLTRNGAGLMICGQVFFTDHDRVRQNVSNLIRMVQTYREEVWRWFRLRHLKSFYTAVIASSLREGVQTLVQTAGIGRLRPNILLIGFKSNWRESPLQEINEYYNTIVDAFEANLAVAILRLPHGLDLSEIMDLYNISDTHMSIRRQHDTINRPLSARHRNESVATLASIDSMDYVLDEEIHTLSKSCDTLHTTFDDFTETDSAKKPNCPTKTRRIVAKMCPCAEASPAVTGDKTETPMEGNLNDLKKAGSIGNLVQPEFNQKQQEVVSVINKFKRKIKNAVIDVWWLFDDGGLTLLLPHLLSSNRSCFHGAKLRVFTIANSLETLKAEQQNLVTLLNKFRLRFSDVEVLPDLAKEPDANRIKQFNDIIAPYIIKTHEDGRSSRSKAIKQGYLTQPQLTSMKEKTYRHIRIRELLELHSADSQLVVITLPVPRKSVCSSTLYMAWLEYLTHGGGNENHMPPVLLVRGNQQSVLTFYS